MTSKTKKTRSDSFSGSLPHPCLRSNHLICVRVTIASAALLCLAAAAALPAPRFQSSSSSSSSGRHGHDFVIFTTVFNDRGFALYGARTRLRRADEKKFRWETTSDHQGELAFRVPQGAQYEMTVEARGFKPETRKIDATQDLRTDLTIRMEPLADPSAAPGAKPFTGGKP